MVAGRVVRFDNMRGYGFISPSNGGEDIFLHVNDLLVPEQFMRAGVHVEFEIQDGSKGLKAAAVRLAESSAGAMSQALALARPQLPAQRAPEPHHRAPLETPQLPVPDSDTEPLCDVLDETEYLGEVTELLLQAVPALSGEQILRIREALVTFGKIRGWIDPVHSEAQGD